MSNDSTITGIILNKSVLNLEKGNSEQLIATIISDTTQEETITWDSSDNSIATVDSDGNVTAIDIGNCTISASVESFTASCETNVGIYPTSISLNYSEIIHVINATDVEDLEVIFEPDDCTERTIVWTSTNENVVKYDTDLNQLVYSGESGQCTITATDVVGNTASCLFMVYGKAPKPAAPIISSIGETQIVLEEIPYGEYSIDSGNTWKSNPVFNNLEYNKTYYITQREKAHDKYSASDQSDYTVATTKDIVHVESVTLDTHELILDIDDGLSEHQFIPTILPTNAEIKTVYYSLDNTTIGYVNSDGELKAIGCGEGIVTVTTIEGAKTDTCNVKVYKKWDTPEAPVITAITTNSITLLSDDVTVFSIDNGNVWQKGPIISGLTPKKSYNVICKRLADGYRTESDISPKTYVTIPENDPDPSGQPPVEIRLSAHKLYFDITNNNTYATLFYSISPSNVSDTNVIWYTTDSSVISIGSGGEINAIGCGHAMVYVRTISGGRTDCCECFVYETVEKPEAPTTKEITMHSIELNPIENGEYSIDGTNWISSPLFNGLMKNTYYTLYQRIKGSGEYRPPSDPSYGLTVKTLTDETPGGQSESGYTWGQEVECNNIPVYSSPYVDKSNFKISGRYYIFNLIECNHRIRLVRISDFVGVYGHAIGWVNISDLKLIESVIYVGDKVVVDGDINIYADGSGVSIHKNKETMYVTDIIDGVEYCYGVTTKPGQNRQGFAKGDQVTKYKSIIING